MVKLLKLNIFIFIISALVFLLGLDFCFKGKVYQHVQQARKEAVHKSKMRALTYQRPDFTPLKGLIASGKAPANADPFIAYYKKAAELFPASFEAHYLLGVSQLLKGDNFAAGESLERSLELNPDFFWGYYDLALVHIRQGDHASAMALLDKARLLNDLKTLEDLLRGDLFRQIRTSLGVPEGLPREHLAQGQTQVRQLISLLRRVLKDPSVPTDWVEKLNPVLF